MIKKKKTFCVFITLQKTFSSSPPPAPIIRVNMPSLASVLRIPFHWEVWSDSDKGEINIPSARVKIGKCPLKRDRKKVYIYICRTFQALGRTGSIINDTWITNRKILFSIQIKLTYACINDFSLRHNCIFVLRGSLARNIWKVGNYEFTNHNSFLDYF